jgi:hypothetical protein
VQIPVPSSYITRLKVIYNEATKAVHKAEASITATETSADQYQASVTMQGSTYAYSDIPHKNAASAEASAIYYSLKQISNIHGYQIMDLNYPILSELTMEINNLCLHIGLLQCCVSYATADINQIYEGLGHLVNEYSMTTEDIQNNQSLDSAIKDLDNSIIGYHQNINSSADQFTETKVTLHRLCSYSTYTHKLSKHNQTTYMYRSNFFPHVWPPNHSTIHQIVG